MASFEECDGVLNLAGCPGWFRTFLLVITILTGLAVIPVALSAKKHQLILKDMKWTNMTPPQMLIVVPILSLLTLTVGMLLLFVVPSTPITRAAGGVFMYGFGFCLFVYNLQLYMLYWVTILAVKRSEYERELEAKANKERMSGKLSVEEVSSRSSASAISDEQKRRAARTSLALAKQRKTLERGIKYVAVVTFVANFTLSVVLALGGLSVEAKAIVQFLLWFVISLDMAPGIVILLTVGRVQVKIYDKPSVTQLWMMNTSVCVIVGFVILSIGVGSLLKSATMIMIVMVIGLVGCEWAFAVLPILTAGLLRTVMKKLKRGKMSGYSTSTVAPSSESG